MGRLKVAVLMGGDSAEREVSLRTGEQILAALDADRYEAWPVDAAVLRHLATEPAASLFSERPDVVFVALHGPGGEDGSVQGLLDVLGIPYTGSGVLASALAMDKAMSKRVLAAVGVPVPWSRLIHSEADAARCDDAPLPLVVKPNRQGSSFGMTIVRDRAVLPEAAALALRYDCGCLLEEFVPGTEITVSVIGNRHPRALPVLEIVPRGEFYDYASKYEVGGSEHVIPARITEAARETATRHAIACHETLGCRGMSRTDLIARGDEAWVLEVNTIPGMTPTSLLPDAARAAGIAFPELLDHLIGYALSQDERC